MAAIGADVPIFHRLRKADNAGNTGHRLDPGAYLSSALTHAFDVCYYPCLDATRGARSAFTLHGNEGTEGAERAVEAITAGLGWQRVAPTVVVSGKATRNLGATFAALLMGE